MILQLSPSNPATAGAAASGEVVPSTDAQGGAFDQAMQQADLGSMDAVLTLPNLAQKQGTSDTESPSKEQTPSDAMSALLAPLMTMNWQAPTAMATTLGMWHNGAQGSAHDTEPSAQSGSEAQALTGGSPLSAHPIQQAPIALLSTLAITPVPYTPSALPSTSSNAAVNGEQAAGTQNHPSNLASSASQGAADVKTAEQASLASSTPAPTTWSGVIANLNDRLSTPSANPHAPLALSARNPDQWREPLLNTLGERVQWQMHKGIDQAVIRLEPPHLGRVDIVIRQADGVMQVHLSATHQDVVQQLQGVSDGLKQELSMRQTAEVNVQVSDQSRGSDMNQGQGRNQKDEPTRSPGRALGEASEHLAHEQVFSMQAEQG